VKTFVLGAGLALALSGCAFRGANQLYAVPQPSKDYEALQVRLSEVLAAGGEYAAPLSGELIQSVQLQDLDGDGYQEALAFFRIYTDEKPLKIYIFHQTPEGEYQVQDVIEGAGTAINSIEYAQITGDGFKELVVTWQMSDTARSLGIYSVAGGQAEEILRTDYDSYKLSDLDGDGEQEVAVLRTPAEDPDSTGATRPQAELYDFDGVLGLAGTAPLSRNITSVGSGGMRAGYLVDRVPALFAVSSYGENGAATITDIITYQNGELKNITLVPDDPNTDPYLGESRETIRAYTQVTGSDINADGIMELPRPIPLGEGSTVNTWLIQWRQFDKDGVPHPIFTTYHNDRDGWYFILPEEWGENVALSRSETPGGGERAVTISYTGWNGKGEPTPLITFYKLTGTNRVRRASLPGRFVLFPAQGLEGAAEANTIYAARFEDGWDNSLTEAQVRERFNIIKTDWSGGN